MNDRRQVSVSYYHEEDQDYKESFEYRIPCVMDT